MMSKFNQILGGLSILNTYPDPMFSCDHDQIWAGPEVEVSPDDAKKLEELGWFYSVHEDSWSIFV
jgi:hypothetical protein